MKKIRKSEDIKFIPFQRTKATDAVSLPLSVVELKKEPNIGSQIGVYIPT